MPRSRPCIDISILLSRGFPATVTSTARLEPGSRFPEAKDATFPDFSDYIDDALLGRSSEIKVDGGDIGKTISGDAYFEDEDENQD